MSGQLQPVRRIALALPLLLALGVAPITDSDSTTSGPIVSSNRPKVDVGGYTVLTIDGFISPYVTISICGNEARRGSADCNMSASEGVEVRGDAPLALQMPVAAPPVDCPCVIRVVGKDSGEVAVAPIDLTDHPIGPLVDPPVFGDLVAVSIVARKTPEGAVDALRSALGGRTNYSVTVRVKNLATSPLKQVSVSASAGRSAADDSLVSLELEDPGLIGVGQTWQQTVDVVIPSPAFGSTEWRAAVSGAGQTVVGTSVTEHRPWLLIVLVLVVVLNTSLLLIRWRMRRRAAGLALQPDDTGSDAAIDAASTDSTSIGAPDATVENAREFMSSST